MKVKRYEAPTLQEAVRSVKDDLGLDAVILQTRKFTKGGIFGLMGKEMVEVLAGIEEEGEPRLASAQQARPVSAPRAATGSYAAAAKRPAQDQAHNSNASGANGSQGEDLKSELRELRSILKSYMAQKPVSPDSVKPYPAIFGDIYLQLIENDVEIPVAQEIIKSLNEAVPEEDQENSRAVMGYLHRHLMRLLKASGGIQLTPGSPKTVVFIGPTGVGKTTTIAKLATLFQLAKRKKVGLITADTYRIAAVEQLKVYGDILDVPVKVVYNGEDMTRALHMFSDRDIIFIDTAGRSHRDTSKLQDLRDILSPHFPLEIHLVLNTSTRFKDMVDIADNFRILPYNNVISTKLDEASSFGNILNIITKFNVGVSYLCYGQSVPEQIRAASYDLLVDLTMGKSLEKTFGVRLN